MKIGILKEGKIPVDRRTPLLPQQCKAIEDKYPQISFLVQSSPVRCIPDSDYTQLGIPVLQDISDCDVFLGVKEVPIPELIPYKTYFFFSHTTKKQPYNRELLRTILKRHITLIDYENLTNEKGSRLVAFGYFAGVVGAYNAILTFGRRYHLFALRAAHQLRDKQEMWQEFKKIRLPAIKIAVTGTGRVAQGVRDVLQGMHITQVSPPEYLDQTFAQPVFTLLASEDYYKPIEDKSQWDKQRFYQHPEEFKADFYKYIPRTNILISAHYWNPQADVLFHVEDTLKEDFKVKVIADITCDVNGSIPTTLEASSVHNPNYDFDPQSATIKEAFSGDKHISVMAVDNLPSELPLDASETFGAQVSRHIIPALMNNDGQSVLQRATIAQQGELMPNFLYLSDYVEGKE